MAGTESVKSACNKSVRGLAKEEPTGYAERPCTFRMSMLQETYEVGNIQSGTTERGLNRHTTLGTHISPSRAGERPCTDRSFRNLEKLDHRHSVHS